MKRPNRRTVLHLTPLLDLLLIVIFAQFLGVQVASSQSAAELEEARDALRRQIARRERQLERRGRELEKQRQEQARAIASLVQQQTRAGAALLELLQLSETKHLEQIENSASSFPNAERLALVRKQVMSQDGREFVEFLIRYSEMSKHCDLWELYVTAEGTIEFDDGRTVKKASAKTVDEIVDVLFEAYKSFPDAKTLVIVLFSYGDVLEPTYDAIKLALPQALARMRADAGGRRWFESAELGYLPEGPSLRRKRDP